MIEVNGESIYRAETFYQDVSEDDPEPVAFWAPRAFCPRGVRYRRPQRAAKATVAYARVDHGRWVVDCPTRRCRAAQVASETDPRFFCHVCQNAAEDGAWLAVKWPPPAERREIETLLLLRPEAENRNWAPGETLDMARAENLAHGCSIRTGG